MAIRAAIPAIQTAEAAHADVPHRTTDADDLPSGGATRKANGSCRGSLLQPLLEGQIAPDSFVQASLCQLPQAGSPQQ